LVFKYAFVLKPTSVSQKERKHIKNVRQKQKHNEIERERERISALQLHAITVGS
jgi:hypothetical protein